MNRIGRLIVYIVARFLSVSWMLVAIAYSTMHANGGAREGRQLNGFEQVAQNIITRRKGALNVQNKASGMEGAATPNAPEVCEDKNYGGGGN